MSNMFSECGQLTAINFGDKFNTSLVTHFSSIFYEVRNVSNLDLSGFDTGSATSMTMMFYGMKNLETLNLGDNFDTTNVTSMTNMFVNTDALHIIDLGTKFDTSNAYGYNTMFKYYAANPSKEMLIITNDSNIANIDFDDQRIVGLSVASFEYYDENAVNTLDERDLALENVVYVSEAKAIENFVD